MNTFKKLVNVFFLYSIWAFLGTTQCFALDCNLNDTPADFSLYATIAKNNKIRSVPTLNLRYEMLQHQISFASLPEGLKNCFLNMKETSMQMNAEVGGVIALFDNSDQPLLQQLTSNQKRSISGVDIQKAFDTILAIPNSRHLNKIILVHTHPAGADSIPFHSPNDAHVAKNTEDQFSQKLGHHVAVESAVLPLHEPFKDKFVVGAIAQVEDYGY